MKINDKKVIGVIEYEPWEAEEVFRAITGNWLIFKEDAILRRLSDTILERLEELQGYPDFDSDINDFAVVALSNKTDDNIN